MSIADYNQDSIQTLDWNEHIRQRPGMYIGNLGDGSAPEHGIYVILKEVVDNSIDEFAAGYGKVIEINIEDNNVMIRDYGRGIPLEKLVDTASKLNTGGKFNSKVFHKSVGLNGVGLKATNATSSHFYIESFRNGKSANATFSAGYELERGGGDTKEKNGTLVRYTPDEKLFVGYNHNMEFIEEMVKNYSYLNRGLTLKLNGVEYKSNNGLLDLITDGGGDKELLYPPIHLIGKDIELVITHGHSNGENISSFVNGQNTTEGGTHLAAFRESVAKTVKDFYQKNYEPADIRQSIVGAISIRVMEPVFGNQTKTKLNSRDVEAGLPIRNFIGDFIKDELDNFLHKHKQTADIIQKKIQESEKERKAINTIQRATKEKVKKASLCNRKLRDCRVHYNDVKNPLHRDTTLFITEGDSASGSITKIRNASTQAVFSLRGKPLNTYQTKDKEVYSNEEFILLKAALNIDEDFDNLRYNNVVIATDADVDGMHIRLLLLTYFLKYYPELVRKKHVYILQTPLFRVRNKTKTLYCYSDEEKQEAIKSLKGEPEITRFKGLGEISHDEFKVFIGEEMRLDPVRLSADDDIGHLLEFYMGDNTPDRKNFIKQNLRADIVLEII